MCSSSSFPMKIFAYNGAQIEAMAQFSFGDSDQQIFQLARKFTSMKIYGAYYKLSWYKFLCIVIIITTLFSVDFHITVTI